MTKHAILMDDMRQIIDTIGSIQYVGYGPHKGIDIEDTFGSAYILPGSDVFSPKRTGTGVTSYDNSFFVRVIINEDCSEDPLLWCKTRDDIIQAILQDTPMWTNVTDRDVVSVVYDNMNNFPKMTFEVIFEFILRDECN